MESNTKVKSNTMVKTFKIESELWIKFYSKYGKKSDQRLRELITQDIKLLINESKPEAEPYLSKLKKSNGYVIKIPIVNPESKEEYLNKLKKTVEDPNLDLLVRETFKSEIREAEEKVAMIGTIGSGKTTVAGALEDQFEADESNLEEKIEAVIVLPSGAELPIVSSRVKCAKCGMPTMKPVTINDQAYCQRCSVSAKPKHMEHISLNLES